MTNQYAGSLFNTDHEATLAAVYDWCTACGDEDAEESAEAIAKDIDASVEEMIESGWEIPNVDMANREELRELIQGFVSEYS